jgi:hypothetical protein
MRLRVHCRLAQSSSDRISFDCGPFFARILGMLRFSGVSLVTFFAPAKKVTRWRAATAEALLSWVWNRRARSKWIPAFDKLRTCFRRNDEQKARAKIKIKVKIKIKIKIKISAASLPIACSPDSRSTRMYVSATRPARAVRGAEHRSQRRKWPEGARRWIAALAQQYTDVLSARPRRWREAQGRAGAFARCIRIARPRAPAQGRAGRIALHGRLLGFT